MEGAAQSSDFTKKYRMYTEDLRKQPFSYEKDSWDFITSPSFI